MLGFRQTEDRLDNVLPSKMQGLCHFIHVPNARQVPRTTVSSTQPNVPLQILLIGKRVMESLDSGSWWDRSVGGK